MTQNNHPPLRPLLDTLLHWGLIASCLTAPFIIVPGTYSTVKIPQMAFIQLSVFFLFTVWLLKNIGQSHMVIHRSPFYRPIIALAAWSLFTIVFAANKFEGFTIWRHGMSTAVFFFLVLQDCRDGRHRSHYFAALFIAACGMAVLGISQHLFNLQWIPQAAPPAAMFINRNMAAQFMVLTVPLGIFYLLVTTNIRLQWPLFLFFSLMLVFVVYTGSRAGWLAIIIQVFLFIYLTQKQKILKKHLFRHTSRTIPLIMAITIFLLLINTGPKGLQWNMGKIADRAASITQTNHTDNKQESLTSAGLRLAFWTNTMAMIKDNLFTGVGAGNFKIIYPLYSQRLVRDPVFNYNTQLHRTHNDFLQAFAELGLIGFMILLWLVVEIMKVGRGVLMKSNSDHDKLLVITVMTIMAGIGINACFSFPFQRPIPPFIFMIMLGIIGSVDPDETRPYYYFSQSTKMSILASIISLLLLLIVGRIHLQSLRFDRLAFQMAVTETTRQWDELINQGRIAFNQFPNQVSYLSPLGKAFIEKKMYRKAEQTLTSSIKYYPNSINDNMNLGMSLTNIGEFDRATTVYHKALAINPYLSKTHFNMGLLLEKQGHLPDALQEYITAAKLEPTNNIMHIAVGKIQALLGEYEAAAQSFSKALAIEPNSGITHKNIGIIYHQFLNQPKEARTHLQRALELNPQIYGAEQIKTILQDQ